MNRKLDTVKIAKTNSAVLGPWTLIEVVDESGIRGYGASHKSKADKWNADLGYNIALGRAKKDLFNKFYKIRTREHTVFVG